MAELKHTEENSASGVFENCNNHIREKLVELLREGIMFHYFLTCEEQADYLLANGVTVQEWIPVTDDSPKNGVKVLIANEDIVMRGYRRPDGVWKYGAELHERWDKLSLFPPTHWMPLPTPPKGE